MKHLKRAVIPLVALSISLASPSLAAVFTVDGTDYDVITISGSFIEHETVLKQQIWWGDIELANKFATSVKFDLGTRYNVGDTKIGPSFATNINEFNTDVNVQEWIKIFTDPGLGAWDILLGDTSAVWAITTSSASVSVVPLPAGGLLLLSGWPA